MRSSIYIVPELFAGSHVIHRLLSGWELSAITTPASGTPSSASSVNYAQRPALLRRSFFEGNYNMLGKTIAQSATGASAGHSRALTTILYAGLIAGALDITSAFINGGLHGRGPVWVLQSVAGGLMGRNTFQGGLKTAALGLALHFLIATTWAAVYYSASLKLPLLTRQAVVCGLLYGIVVYLFMYTIVLPLSALRFKFFNQSASAILTGVLIHLFCVGLPIALVTRWRGK